MIVWLVILLVALAGAFLALHARPELAAAMMNIETGAIAFALALVLYVTIILTTNRSQAATTLRHLAVWGGLMLALVVGYSYRQEVAAIAYRVAGDLAPPGVGVAYDSGIPGERAVRIRRRGDGHFMASATVNGTQMPLMVDTGASTVVLTSSDATRAGIAIKSLSFTVAVNTANGVSYAAPVRLQAIAIGPLQLRDVDALVAKPGSLNESLLGMSFLRKLRSFEFSGEYLTLRG